MSEAPEGLHVDERRLAAIWPRTSLATRALWGATKKRRCATRSAPGGHPAAHRQARRSIINIAGDGIVAQFPSAVRAVECAVAIQKSWPSATSSSRRTAMLLRIGVNLGDIIHDGTRTYGDGIDVAARLEPLAEPGGIAFRRRCARRSSASSACPCAISARSRSRTSTGRSTSIRSSRPGRACAPRLAGRGSAPISPTRTHARAYRSPRRRRERRRMALLAARDDDA